MRCEGFVYIFVRPENLPVNMPGLYGMATCTWRRKSLGGHSHCKFYAEVRRKDGEDYEPDSLAIMQASLDRHLKNVGRPYSILRDRQFQLFSYYPNCILMYNIINT